jgi:hypothetical protein
VIDRRQFLGTAASLIAVSVAASLRAAMPAPAAQRADADARLNALFDVFMDEGFAKNPQLLTSLGLDKGKYAWARAKLNDASLERARAAKLENASRSFARRAAWSTPDCMRRAGRASGRSTIWSRPLGTIATP